jgi:hypothetical protein
MAPVAAIFGRAMLATRREPGFAPSFPTVTGMTDLLALLAAHAGNFSVPLCGLLILITAVVFSPWDAPAQRLTALVHAIRGGGPPRQRGQPHALPAGKPARKANRRGGRGD